MPDYYELCNECLEHVIAEAKHEFCNQFCRPPFHSGGGTYSETPEFYSHLMQESYIKHYSKGCCKEKGCKHS